MTDELLEKVTINWVSYDLTEQTEQEDIYLPAAVVREMVAEAEEAGQSLSTWVAAALRESLELSRKA